MSAWTWIVCRCIVGIFRGQTMIFLVSFLPEASFANSIASLSPCRWPGNEYLWFLNIQDIHECVYIGGEKGTRCIFLFSKVIHSWQARHFKRKTTLIKHCLRIRNPLPFSCGYFAVLKIDNYALFSFNLSTYSIVLMFHLSKGPCRSN